MDPDSTLERLQDALNARDFDGSTQAYHDLYEWFRKDGFKPTNVDKFPEAWGYFLGRLDASCSNLFIR